MIIRLFLREKKESWLINIELKGLLQSSEVPSPFLLTQRVYLGEGGAPSDKSWFNQSRGYFSQ